MHKRAIQLLDRMGFEPRSTTWWPKTGGGVPVDVVKAMTLFAKREVSRARRRARKQEAKNG